MAEQEKVNEAKSIMQKMIDFVAGKEVNLEADMPEEKTEMMPAALVVGEYTLPDGRTLRVSEAGAEIMEAEATAEEAAVEEAEMRGDHDKERTEMASQEETKSEASEMVEANKVMLEAIEKLKEQNESLQSQVTELSKAEPLTGVPKTEKIELQQIQQGDNELAQSLKRLHNIRAKKQM